MEREVRNHYHTRAAGGGGPHNNTNRGSSRQRAEPELVPQWGNRKRLRCVKAPRKDKDDDPESNKAAVPTVRVDRRLARVDKEPAVLLRRAPPAHHRVLRNLEAAGATRGQQTNGASAEETAANGGAQAFSDEKKGGASSSGSEGVVWPSLTIALTNKEKEEDFLAFKGSRLPLRPKKRAKLIQRNLSLVSPGSWLCDLTLDRYEVREKKVSKKKPRGLKAMGNMESDSE